MFSCLRSSDFLKASNACFLVRSWDCENPKEKAERLNSNNSFFMNKKVFLLSVLASIVDSLIIETIKS